MGAPHDCAIETKHNCSHHDAMHHPKKMKIGWIWTSLRDWGSCCLAIPRIALRSILGYFPALPPGAFVGRGPYVDRGIFRADSLTSHWLTVLKGSDFSDRWE
jgi:hypothetical protein